MLRVLWTLFLVGSVVGPLRAADLFSLTDDDSSGGTWLVTADVTAEGTFEFQPASPEDEKISHPVTMTSTFRFAERRLPPAGRDDAAFRVLRVYEEAGSQIRVGKQSTAPALRQDRRRIVVRATREGPLAYSPDGPLTATEVELLPFPADSVLLGALLPPRPVGVGERWTPAPWVAPALAGAEVSLNSKLTCQLTSVRDGEAVVEWSGRVEGATKGASSDTTFKGTLTYSIEATAVVAADVTQTEKRSIGPLAPGMTLTLKTVVRRTPAPAEAVIGDADLAAVPLEPAAEASRLEYDAPFGVALTCDRDWQLYHQTDRLLILRLLDQGGLVAQCNVAPGPKVVSGERTSERTFQEDIRRSLGEKFTEIVSAEEVGTGRKLAVYRVTAAGKVGNDDYLWRYYLVTAPDGRQATFVLTYEPANANRLGDRDLQLVASAMFRDHKPPVPAAP